MTLNSSKLFLAIIKIVAQIPTIFMQVHTVQQDLPSKTNAAQDALSEAITDATANLPDHEAQIANTVGAIAQGTLANIIQAVHPATQN